MGNGQSYRRNTTEWTPKLEVKSGSWFTPVRLVTLSGRGPSPAGQGGGGSSTLSSSSTSTSNLRHGERDSHRQSSESTWRCPAALVYDNWDECLEYDIPDDTRHYKSSKDKEYKTTFTCTTVYSQTHVRKEEDSFNEEIYYEYKMHYLARDRWSDLSSYLRYRGAETNRLTYGLLTSHRRHRYKYSYRSKKRWKKPIFGNARNVYGDEYIKYGHEPHPVLAIEVCGVGHVVLLMSKRDSFCRWEQKPYNADCFYNFADVSTTGKNQQGRWIFTVDIALKPEVFWLHALLPKSVTTDWGRNEALYTAMAQRRNRAPPSKPEEASPADAPAGAKFEFKNLTSVALRVTVNLEKHSGDDIGDENAKQRDSERVFVLHALRPRVTRAATAKKDDVTYELLCRSGDNDEVWFEKAAPRVPDCVWFEATDGTPGGKRCVQATRETQTTGETETQEKKKERAKFRWDELVGAGSNKKKNRHVYAPPKGWSVVDIEYRSFSEDGSTLGTYTVLDAKDTTVYFLAGVRVACNDPVAVAQATAVAKPGTVLFDATLAPNLVAGAELEFFSQGQFLGESTIRAGNMFRVNVYGGDLRARCRVRDENAGWQHPRVPRMLGGDHLSLLPGVLASSTPPLRLWLEGEGDRKELWIHDEYEAVKTVEYKTTVEYKRRWSTKRRPEKSRTQQRRGTRRAG
eukprot:TRINITY_DN16598_c0_g2_i2.p1 TRINITY_DN16598_c0_g2~~TRINITY_DN16598_c0_g2_i2.p1  ORF type:complete len:684 (+),score=10.94 TRINITY_DN16598_c0_g2_i2:47-2098(+)